MKQKLEAIESLVIKNGGYESFDTWGSKERSSLYNFLKNEFKDKGVNSFKGVHGSYLVTYARGRSGIGGMDMGSPDTMIVKKIVEYPG